MGWFDDNYDAGNIQTSSGRDYGVPTDINAPGAASDPFAYTMGSLLTPWTGKFTAPVGSGPAARGVDMAAFKYADANFGSGVNVGSLAAPPDYQAAAPFSSAAYVTPEAYKGQGPLAPAEKFSYREYQAPAEFRGITEEQLRSDPSYQFRLKQGQGALESSAAAKGLLRTGGTMKGLINYGQEAASQEYGAAYGRALGESQKAADEGLRAYQTQYGVASGDYDRNQANRLSTYNANEQFGQSAYDMNARTGLQGYQTNYNVASGDFDRNEANRFNAAQANATNRLGAFSANANAQIGAGGLNYQIASGTYDRNQANAKAAYDSEFAIASSAAGAAGSNANAAYSRALNEYGMAQDDFYTNQDRQYGKLMGVAQLGQQSAGAVGAYGSGYGQNSAGLTAAAANARAAGTVGASNAYGAGLANSLNTLGGLAGTYYANQSPATSRSRGNPYYSA